MEDLMYIHPDLYQEIQNIHKRKDKTDFERFTLKKEAIEKTKTTLGAIISEEQPKHKEKNVITLNNPSLCFLCSCQSTKL